MANQFRQSSNQAIKQATLQFALNGQLFENSDDAGYVYPRGDGDTVPWLLRREYRVILQELNVRDLNKGCVSVWLTQDGVCYSLCRRRPGRGGSDTVAAVVCSPVAAVDTHQMLLQLGNMLDYAIGIASNGGQRANIDDNRVAEYLEGMNRCFGSLKPTQSGTGGTEPKPMAWKEYARQEQMEKDLRFLPFQQQLQQYQAVHLVLNTDHDAGVSENMKEYTYRIDTVYAIDTAESNEGVSVSMEGDKKYIMSGEQFTVVYSKEGYLPERKSGLYVGLKNSPYFDVDYTRNVIRPIPYNKSLGIRFIKRITLIVQNEDGYSVPDWEWSSKTKRMLCGNSKHDIELTEGEHDIVIKASKYVDQTVHIDTAINPDPVVLKLMGFNKKAEVVPAWKGTKPGVDNTITLSGKIEHWLYGKFNLSPSSPKPKLYVSKSSPWLWVLLAGLLMGAAGVMAGHYLWKTPTQTQPVQNTGSATTPPDKSNEGQQDPKPQPSRNETGMTQAELEAADKDYLERNGLTWYRDSLQSEKYLKFFDVVLPNGTLDRNINWDASMLDFMKAIKHNSLRKYVASYEEAKKKNEQPLWDVFNQYAKKLKTAVSTGMVDWNTIFAQPKNTPVTSQPRSDGGNEHDVYESV